MDTEFLKRLQKEFTPIIDPIMLPLDSCSFENVLDEISLICHLNKKQLLNLIGDISEVTSQTPISSIDAALFVLDKVKRGMELCKALAWLRCK